MFWALSLILMLLHSPDRAVLKSPWLGPISPLWILTWGDTPWFFLLRILSLNEGRHAQSPQPGGAFWRRIFSVKWLWGREEQWVEHMIWYGWRTESRAGERSVPPCAVIWPLRSLSWSDLGKLLSSLPACLPAYLPPPLPLLSSDNLLPVWCGGLIRNNFPLIEWKYHEASDDKTAGRKRSSKIRSLYFLWEFLNVFLGFIQSRCSKT